MLLAVDVGKGLVPRGPTAAKAGRKVATVLEGPSVEASDVEVFRTHMYELQIVGTGSKVVVKPIIDFEPELTSDSIYMMDVVNRTMVRLSLASTSAEWTYTENLGPLRT